MVNIAVLGYGVVGSGVVEVIKTNSLSISNKAGKTIKVKKVLDIRDFPESPDKDILTKNADEVFNDDSISIVVETIGGAKIAYEFTKRALSAGKHVVTSNKELVATHGPELLKLAKDNNVNYLFEASVGGGIPIIRPLNQCLAANEISSVTGILNGTTNYILTRMKKDGKDFGVALKGAQENGYAEADPTADIEGHDACRKIAILSSIAYGEFVNYNKIYTEGITKVSLTDMEYAESMNSVIKLIATSTKDGDKIFARVSPAIISKSNPLSNVEDVFNAIVVKGNAIGEAMFYGPGAGKLPTASAVVADVIDIVLHINSNARNTWHIPSEDNIINYRDVETKYFVRLKIKDTALAKKTIESEFGNVKWVKNAHSVNDDELAFVSNKALEGKLQEAVNNIRESQGLEVINVIRVME